MSRVNFFVDSFSVFILFCVSYFCTFICRFSASNRYVQQKTNSPVDMRVGVHTGAVLAGILGQRQWQYDVYSKDVELANKMESSGMAGYVLYYLFLFSFASFTTYTSYASFTHVYPDVNLYSSLSGTNCI